MKIPGPDHPITIEAADARVRVTFEGEVIADTKRALKLQESTYPAVYYIPKDDVAMDRLVSTPHSTYCPYKGDAGYYAIGIGDHRSENAVWVYERTYPAVKQIEGHLAFYESRVDSIEVDERSG